jgi:hypothetical protein
MIKVREFQDIKPIDKVTILSSYRGYVSYVPRLNDYVGMDATVIETGNNNSSVHLAINNFVKWWYPSYALKFEGDDSPITAEKIKIGDNYAMMSDNLDIFHVMSYQNDPLPDYNGEKGINILIDSTNYEKLNRGTIVKALQVVSIRPEFNDIIVLCEVRNTEKHYLPITSLYKMYPSYSPRKFVYEFKDWNKLI